MPRKPNAPLPQPLFSEPVFAEGVPTPDPNTFRQPHPSDKKLYDQIQDLLTKDVVSFSAARGKPGDIFSLQTALGDPGAAAVKAIQSAGQIVFHAAGDTGCSNVKKYTNELSIADHLANDCHISPKGSVPSFLYHLGDVVYDFGESQYYYDQFYEPFRDYPAPIFAIPGNHDSFVVPATKAADFPLVIFARNFCNTKTVVTKEAGPLYRTSMTQPGLYFTLDAPFVRIIGLFSNALEDPGIISSEKGKWKAVPDVQLAYLTAQLQLIKAQKYAGAVILAVHHPPFCYDPPKNVTGAGGNHSSSTPMLRDIDTICQSQGVYPHAFLTAHAHNYQRYTRKLNFAGAQYSVPFIVCGDGGHNVNPLVQARKGKPTPPDPTPHQDVTYMDTDPAVQSTGLTIEKFDHTNYGYLRITVDKNQLRIEFHPVGQTATQVGVDTVTIDLASHSII